jgi:hypothetical protein
LPDDEPEVQAHCASAGLGTKAKTKTASSTNRNAWTALLVADLFTMANRCPTLAAVR